MFTILLSLLACGEEKVDDSAQPVEEQQEQEDVPVEDTGEETIEDTASAEWWNGFVSFRKKLSLYTWQT